MAGIRIVTDSTADLPENIIKEFGITVVPLIVRFGHEALRAGVEITNDEFYHRLTVDPVHPSTSKPSPGDFVEAYKKLLKDADEIISIHISAALSGTCDSAISASTNDEINVTTHVVDSRTGSLGLGHMVRLAAQKARDGVGAEQILNELDNTVRQTRTCFVVETLEFLKRGGRIGAAQAFLGSMLKVKPILHIMNGVVEPLDRVRSSRKAIDRIVRYVREESGRTELEYAGLMYTTDDTEATAIRAHIDAEFEVRHWYVAKLGAVIGAHMGPGTVGLTFPAKKL